MAKITSTQRAQLEAAGFSVGKSGNTVQNKDGKTVGGFNVNGNIFSGNDKVAGILRTKEAPTAPEKTAKAPQRRSATPTPKSSAPASSPRPKARPAKETPKAPRKQKDDDASVNPAKPSTGGKPAKGGPSATDLAPLVAIPAWRSRKQAGKPTAPAKDGPKQIRQRPVPYKPESGLTLRERVARGVSRAGGAGAFRADRLDDMNRMQLPLLKQYSKGGMVKKCSKT